MANKLINNLDHGRPSREHQKITSQDDVGMFGFKAKRSLVSSISSFSNAREN